MNPVGDPQFNRQQDQTNASRVSLGGGGIRANNYLLEGVPITELRGRAIANPTIEAIEEVKVQVHTYDAEMGRTGGGVFNVTRQIRHQRVPRARLLSDPAGLGAESSTSSATKKAAPRRSPAWLIRYYRLYGGGIRRADLPESDVLLGGDGRLPIADDARPAVHLADSAAARRAIFLEPPRAEHRSGCSTPGAAPASPARAALRRVQVRLRPAASSPTR